MIKCFNDKNGLEEISSVLIMGIFCNINVRINEQNLIKDRTQLAIERHFQFRICLNGQ